MSEKLLETPRLAVGPAPFSDHSEADLDRYLHVIVKGTFLTS